MGVTYSEIEDDIIGYKTTLRCIHISPRNKIKKIIKKVNKVSQRIKILREGKQIRSKLTSDKKVR